MGSESKSKLDMVYDEVVGTRSDIKGLIKKSAENEARSKNNTHRINWLTKIIIGMMIVSLGFLTVYLIYDLGGKLP